MNNRQSLITGAVAISLAAIMWGLDGVVLTPNLYNLDVIWVVFILHALPFILMHIFLFGEYKKLKSFTGNDYLVIFLIALFGGAIGTMSIVKALFLINFKELSIVVLLQKLQPIFAIVLAGIILKERITRHFVLWASVALLGGYFLTFGFNAPDLHTGSKTALSAMFALLAALSFGSSTVFSKLLLQKHSFKTATFYRYGFTSLIMLLFIIVTGNYIQFDQITRTNWIIFLIIAVTTGSGAIFLYYFGLNRVKASFAIICELFFPISTIVFDYVFNGSRLSAVQWASAVVMITAIINLNRLHSIEKSSS